MREYFFRRAQKCDLASIEHEHTVGQARDIVHVVRDHNERDAAFMQTIDEAEEFIARSRVETCHRLVEHEHTRILRDGACEHDALALPVAYLHEVALGELFHMRGFHGLVDPTMVVGRECAHSPGVGMPSRLYDIAAGEELGLGAICQHNGKVPCELRRLPSGNLPPVELDRAGKLHTNVHSIDYPTLEAKLADWDIMRPTCTEEAQQMYKAAPGHIISPEPWTHTTLFDSLDRDRANGAIHDINHPEIHEGGLAVLRGNLAPDGCVVKTAGVPPEIWKFRGPALVVDSQEQAIEVILNDTLKPGMALVIRYEGPKGGPGMQEMLYPTSFVKGKGIGKQVAMLTDGRYSGGSSGLAIGHMAPEAANKGPVALIKNGDIIDIDIEARSVNVELTDEQLDERRRELEAGDGYVAHRNRHVSQALKAYAAFARSADKGATRDPELINKLSGLD